MWKVVGRHFGIGLAPNVSKHVFGRLRMEGFLPTLVETSGD